MQKVLQSLSSPWTRFLLVFQEGLRRRRSAVAVARRAKAKAKEQVKSAGPTIDEVDAAIIKAWYAPTTSSEVHYFDSDCIKLTPAFFPNILTK